MVWNYSWTFVSSLLFFFCTAFPGLSAAMLTEPSSVLPSRQEFTLSFPPSVLLILSSQEKFALKIIIIYLKDLSSQVYSLPLFKPFSWECHEPVRWLPSNLLCRAGALSSNLVSHRTLLGSASPAPATALPVQCAQSEWASHHAPFKAQIRSHLLRRTFQSPTMTSDLLLSFLSSV